MKSLELQLIDYQKQMFTLVRNIHKQKRLYILLPAFTALATLAFIFYTNTPNPEWTRSTANIKEYYDYTITLSSNMYITEPTNKEIWRMTIFLLLGGFFTVFIFIKGWVKNNSKLMYTLAILLGGSILFNILNIYGRAGMGASNALASRYIPIGMLGAYAIYLLLTSIKPVILRTIALVLFTLVLIRPQRNNEGRMRFFEKRSADFKQFETCLLQNETTEPCLTLAAKLNIHPANKKDDLKLKLAFMKENKLSIFKNP